MSKVLANERRCYICNIFSHWLRPWSVIDRKQTQMTADPNMSLWFHWWNKALNSNTKKTPHLCASIEMCVDVGQCFLAVSWSRFSVPTKPTTRVGFLFGSFIVTFGWKTQNKAWCVLLWYGKVPPHMVSQSYETMCKCNNWVAWSLQIPSIHPSLQILYIFSLLRDHFTFKTNLRGLLERFPYILTRCPISLHLMDGKLGGTMISTGFWLHQVDLVKQEKHQIICLDWPE